MTELIAESAVSPLKKPERGHPAELISSVGLMLDLDRNVQLYHAWRVAVVGYHLAKRLAAFEAPHIFFAGMLADCGGIRFERHIVHELIDSPSVLGQKSQTHLFFHPVVGAEMVRRIPGMRRVARLVLHHHECINGAGYPEGQIGDDIDMSAQILRLADQVDLTLRADSPESLDELLHVLDPYAGEDYSHALLRALGDLFQGPLSFGRLVKPEKIIQEVDAICQDLSGVKVLATGLDWDRALEAVAGIVDSRNDLYSRGKSSRVAEFSGKIASAMGLAEEERQVARWAAYLQNMGEVSLRRSLLGKSGRLDDADRKLIRYHPVLSHNLIARISGFHEVARAARHHHENWDGSGYPEGLAMTEIPLAARIIRVADSFDAMTSKRPYQRRREWKAAIKELRRQSGKHFDPQVVDAALGVLAD